MKNLLIITCMGLLLSACSAATATPTPQPSLTTAASPTSLPTFTSSPTLTPLPTRTPTVTLTPTQTFIPAVVYSEGAFAGWKQVDNENYSLKVPPDFYIPEVIPPVFFLADSKTTYDTWGRGESIEDKLLIQLMAGMIDRRLDPFDPNAGLASSEEGLRRTVNMTIGLSRYVEGTTDVPWENGNGGTFDGRKNWVESIPFVNLILGQNRAVQFYFTDQSGYYFIFNPNTTDQMVRVNIQPGNTEKLKLAEQILSTLEFVK